MLRLTRREMETLAQQELERREKISAKMLGLHRTEEQRRNISEGTKRSWARRPLASRKQSPDHRQKISAGMKKFWASRRQAVQASTEGVSA